MRIFLTIGLIIVCTSLRAASVDVQDSITVDKRKIERVIKKIKKSSMVKNSKYTIKDFDHSKITFWYPDKIVIGQRFRLGVLYKGETILIYDINPDTYEYAALIDLR